MRLVPGLGIVEATPKFDSNQTARLLEPHHRDYGKINSLLLNTLMFYRSKSNCPLNDLLWQFKFLNVIGKLCIFQVLLFLVVVIS